MPETLVLLVGLAIAAAFVLWPLLRERSDSTQPADDDDAAAVRHRVALEALRDVEADRRAGSLDDAAYAEQLAEAEERATVTRAELERHADRPAVGTRPGARRAAIGGVGLVAAVLLAGSFLPATGIGNATVVNEPLAEAQAAESMRQHRIEELLQLLGDDPEDTETLSSLADEYLLGSTQEDLVRAAVALRLLIELEPQRADAYERIIAAYLRAGDHANARAALDSYAEIDSADPIELSFLDGIVALRGEDDAERAIASFDRFLDLAPDDPRAEMVRGLRAEAAGR